MLPHNNTLGTLGNDPRAWGRHARTSHGTRAHQTHPVHPVHSEPHDDASKFRIVAPYVICVGCILAGIGIGSWAAWNGI